MRRKIEFGIGEYYHIYNRGVDKRAIFTNKAEYKRFLKLLLTGNTSDSIELRHLGGLTSVEPREMIVDIGAYCLMPNHFHLLVRERQEGGLSLFMQKILTSHSMYFNLTHERTGSLFEGAFKAKHLNTDEYLKYNFSYIHLNPLKLIDPNWWERGPKDFQASHDYLKNYPYSSYSGYVGTGNKPDLILNKSAFPEYFCGPKEFIAEMTDWLKFSEHTED